MLWVCSLGNYSVHTRRYALAVCRKTKANKTHQDRLSVYVLLSNFYLGIWDRGRLIWRYFQCKKMVVLVGVRMLRDATDRKRKQGKWQCFGNFSRKMGICRLDTRSVLKIGSNICWYFANVSFLFVFSPIVSVIFIPRWSASNTPQPLYFFGNFCFRLPTASPPRHTIRKHWCSHRVSCHYY